MDEMTFTLHNPLTEEEWDIIEDVDFDHTNSITFHTKHGKDVEFVKRKTGRWIKITTGAMREKYMCSICGRTIEEDGIERLVSIRYPFCHCGAKMEEPEDIPREYFESGGR